MDNRIIEALTLLALTALGGVSLMIRIGLRRVFNELTHNTKITTDARNASNGQLSEALARLAATRNQVVALRMIVREREDRIAYITARIPDAEQLMCDYRDKRTMRHTEAEEVAAERHILDPET
jgi:hypothetical protein